MTEETAIALLARALVALERMLEAHEALMPGIGRLALQNYREQNEAPIEARRTIDAIRAANDSEATY